MLSMLMCIQNLVGFCQFVLKLLSGNPTIHEITESRKDGMTEGQGEPSIAPLFQSGAIIKWQNKIPDTEVLKKA